MNILGTFRDKSRFWGAIVIFLIFLGFIAQSGVVSLSSILSGFSGNVVGKVLDQKIYLEDYLKIASAIQHNNANIDKKELNNLTWNFIIQDKIFNNQIEKLSIEISDAETIDIVQGKHISPLLTEINIFVDGNKNFSKTKLRKYLEKLPSQSIKEQEAWKRFEDAIINKRKAEKIEHLFKSSFYVNKFEKEAAKKTLNKKFKFNCIHIPLKIAEKLLSEDLNEDSMRTDPDFDKKIRNNYAKNKHLYKTENAASILYTVVPFVPTENEIKKFNEDIKTLSQSFANSNDSIEFSISNSDTKIENCNIEMTELDFNSVGVESISLSNLQVGDVIATQINNIEFNKPIRIYKITGLKTVNGYTVYTVVFLEKLLLPSNESKRNLIKLAKELVKNGYNEDDFKKACSKNNFTLQKIFVSDNIVINSNINSAHRKSDIDLIVTNILNKVSDPIETPDGYIVSYVNSRIKNDFLPIEFVYENIFRELYTAEIYTRASNMIKIYIDDCGKNNIENFKIAEGQQVFTNQLANFDECFTNNFLSNSHILGSIINMDVENIRLTADSSGIYVIKVNEIFDLKQEEFAEYNTKKEFSDRVTDYECLRKGVVNLSKVKDYRYKFNIK